MAQRKRALVSVTDKSGLVEFWPLYETGWEFVSTGRTARKMAELGMSTTSIEEVTGFPEMMDGRLKTLHPKVFGGILADRDESSHLEAIAQHGIELFDLVVVNLYDFASDPGIEKIDIGGPSLLRAAAKNHEHVTVLANPVDYREITRNLLVGGSVPAHRRRELARDVFEHTHKYDLMILQWFNSTL